MKRSFLAAFVAFMTLVILLPVSTVSRSTLFPFFTLRTLSAWAAAYNYAATTDVNAGDVVVWDSDVAYGVKATNAQGADTVAGVAAETVAAGNECVIRQDGGRVAVNVVGAVTRGQWLITSATTGKAQGIDDKQAGVFARAITDSGVPEAGQVYASLNLGFLGYGPGTDANSLRGRVISAAVPGDDQVYTWNTATSQWEPTDQPGSVTDHGGLTGLGDDDHAQYLSNARGDARYLFRGNTDPFAPDADYEPATKKYVDDSVVAPGGSDTHIQFNDGGAFGGVAELAWDKVNRIFDIDGMLRVTETARINSALWIYDAGQSYWTTFQGGAQTEDIAYTLPTADGNAGNVLSTDGAGALAWEPPGGGDIFYASTYATLQDAIDAAEANGGGIVKAGIDTYAPIAIDSPNVVLEGMGYGTFIDGGTSGNAITVSAGHTVVRNLRVSTTGGGGSAYGAVVVLATSTMTDIVLDHIIVSDSDAVGMTIYGGDWVLSEISVTDCIIVDADTSGISMNTNSANFSISNNKILASYGGNYGIAVNGDYGSVVGNTIRASTANPIWLTSTSSEVVVAGNHATGTIINSGTNNVVGDNS